MPQADKHDLPSSRPTSLEGSIFENTSPEALHKAIQEAFDYRGDVTLSLHDGSTVDGYLYNFDHKKGETILFVKQEKSSVPQTVAYAQIQKIIFSGADPAFGKSWEDWMTKSERERAKEVERAKQEAEQLGHL